MTKALSLALASAAAFASAATASAPATSAPAGGETSKVAIPAKDLHLATAGTRP